MTNTSRTWIGPTELTIAEPGHRPAYWLRREFDANTSNNARLTLSARGLVEVSINGQRIGDELLPGYTQYDQHIPRRSYDVSDAIRFGANAIVITLADGWFRGQTGAIRGADQFGNATSAWLQIEIGGRPVVSTDTQWTSSLSHILRADLISGQAEDRRLFRTAVFAAGFDDSTWDHAVVADQPEAELVAYQAPPVRPIEEVAPVAIRELHAGVHLVDFGQNLNGWVRLSALGPAGAELTLTHGEALDTDGSLTTDHLRVNFPFLPAPLPAGQVDEVVSAGRDGDEFEPRFTTHGFRYVQIEGHPGPLEASDLVAVVVHSDLERIGHFECSDEGLNALHEAAVWSLRSNMCEIPTDCPHRERLGWTGDWQIFGPTAAFLYDVDAFTSKWLADVRANQQPNGLVANHAPSTPSEGFAGPAAALQGSAGWGDVIVMAPAALYEAYGDKEILAECWDGMVKWIEFGERSARQARSAARAAHSDTPAPHEAFLWDTGFHWGEWMEPGEQVTDFPAFVGADKSEVATAYLSRSASMMSEIAVALGKPSEVVNRFAQLGAAARDAWRREYIADDRLVVQTQASHVRALAFGLAPEEIRAQLVDQLVELIEGAGTTVGTGFLSTGMLLPTLAENDKIDVAYELLLQPTEPGWMAMIDRGATTLWERWEGIDQDGAPHDSLNHYSKGAVVSFLHRYVAGLRPTAPGYRTFEVRPRLGGGLTHATASLQAPDGLIRVGWRRSGSEFQLEVSVPTGTVSTIVLPSGATHVVTTGDHQFAEPC